MTIEGPKTPPEPPLPIVRLVVRILPSAMASKTPMLIPAGPSEMACWMEP